MSVQISNTADDSLASDYEYSDFDEDDGDDGYYNDCDYYGSDDTSDDSAMIVDEEKDPEHFEYKAMDVSSATKFIQVCLSLIFHCKVVSENTAKVKRQIQNLIM